MGMSSKQVSGDHLELNWTQNMLASDTTNNPSSNPRSTAIKRPLQTHQPDPLKCPRCESTNTKFCYYNNYNKTQPRHFCKACKRHWTKGGTLRNVPVGGGRKNKRAKRSNGNTAAVGPATTVDRHHGVHNSLGFSDQTKYLFSDHDKGMFYKPNINDSQGKGVLESYTDNIDRVSWDFNGGFAGNIPQLPHQNLGFSMVSNLSSIDTNPNPIISTSFSPLLTGFKEDSTTRMMMPNSSSTTAINVSHQPWLQVPSTSNFLESNYWNWNDIDSMVQADLNKPFEDPHMKP